MANTSPLTGQRLEYLVPQIAPDYRVLMKESIGNWLGLTPTYPEVGVFKGKGTNKSSQFTKRAGFRYVSYKFLLVPGTKITQPNKGNSTGTTSPVMATISIGFPRGAKGEHTAVHNIINFAIKGGKFGAIMGIVCPSGRKYQWRGKLPKSQPSGTFNGGSTGSSGGGSGGSSGGGGIVGGIISTITNGVVGEVVGGVASAAASAAAGAATNAGASAGVAGLIGTAAGDAVGAAAGLLF